MWHCTNKDTFIQTTQESFLGFIVYEQWQLRCSQHTLSQTLGFFFWSGVQWNWLRPSLYVIWVGSWESNQQHWVARKESHVMLALRAWTSLVPLCRHWPIQIRGFSASWLLYLVWTEFSKFEPCIASLAYFCPFPSYTTWIKIIVHSWIKSSFLEFQCCRVNVVGHQREFRSTLGF